MKNTYTTKEAAELLGLSHDSVGVYIRQGVLAATKHGRDWVITDREIDRYQRERRPRGGGAVLRDMQDVANVETDEPLFIPLSNGDTTVVKGVDRDLYAFKWQVSNRYASRPIKRRVVYMHRIIMERVLGRPLERGEYVDHKDRNTLNNRRSNLRVSTPTQNLVNSKVNSRSRTKLKGVQFKPKLGKWRARIADKHLGYFNSPEDAARAYDKAAIQMYGEFAQLNGVSE